MLTAVMTNLQFSLCYPQPGGELLPYKNIRVVRLREHPLQLVQLEGGVGCAAPLGPIDRVLQFVIITEFIVIVTFFAVTIGGRFGSTAIGGLNKASLSVVVVLIYTYGRRRKC